MKRLITMMPGLLTIAIGFGAGCAVEDGRSILVKNLGLKGYAVVQEPTPIEVREVSYNSDSLHGYKSLEFNADRDK
jgi:hypothetical protein